MLSLFTLLLKLFQLWPLGTPLGWLISPFVTPHHCGVMVLVGLCCWFEYFIIFFISFFKDYIFKILISLFGCARSQLQHVASSSLIRDWMQPLHWENRVLVTGPPGKSQVLYFLTHDFPECQLHSAYPSPRINCFSEEPSEPRLFFISIPCSFHQLMLCLKHLWLDRSVHFSQKHTMQYLEFVLVIQHRLVVTPEAPLSTLVVPRGWSGQQVRVGRHRSGLEGRKGDGVDFNEDMESETGRPWMGLKYAHLSSFCYMTR